MTRSLDEIIARRDLPIKVRVNPSPNGGWQFDMFIRRPDLNRMDPNGRWVWASTSAESYATQAYLNCVDDVLNARARTAHIEGAAA